MDISVRSASVATTVGLSMIFLGYYDESAFFWTVFCLRLSPFFADEQASRGFTF